MNFPEIHSATGMMELILKERLFAMQDKQYAAFQAKLTPGVPVESFIGIRVPVLRKFAKEFTNEAECEDFLQQLPHEYYDENMLHGLLISEVKEYEECIRLTDRFLPFVDNWAVCDIMSPKVFARHKKELLAKIKTWSKSSHVYTCRFGIEVLMSHYLDKDFKAEYLEIPASADIEDKIIMTQDTSTYYVWIGGSCIFFSDQYYLDASRRQTLHTQSSASRRPFLPDS